MKPQEDMTPKMDEMLSPETLWAAAVSIEHDSLFLTDRKIKPFGLRYHGDKLVVPCRSENGNIKNIQSISPDGQINYLFGNNINGLYQSFGPKPEDVIYVAADYASAASIHLATGKPVANALKHENIGAVAGNLAKKLQDLLIVMCLDRTKDGCPDGLDEIGSLATRINASVAIPDAIDGIQEPITFNDLHQHAGLDAVRHTLPMTATLKKDNNTIPPPLPLTRKLPEGKRFPGKFLPEALRGMYDAMSETVKAPPAIIGQSILSAAALAVQPHANVVLDGRIIPLSLYQVSIAASGERKSATDRIALRPHHDHQKNLADALPQRKVAYDIARATWKREREKLMQTSEGSEAINETALHRLGPEPCPPLDPISITEEPTYEGLVKLLQSGQPSIGLFSDEGGRFLGGHAMNDQNQLKTAAGLSKLWDGDPITRTRSQDGSTVLYGRRCSMHLMIQPELGPQLYNSELLIGQGLLSRCLMAYPESNVGNRLYSAQDIWMKSGAQRYMSTLQALLQAPLPIAPGQNNELCPRELTLAADAKEDWVVYHDQIEKKCRSGGPLEDVCGFALKIPEQALRIAGIFALVEEINATEVSADHMNSGITLAEYYLTEALRLYHTSAECKDLVEAEECLQWLTERGNQYFTTVEIYQYGPNKIRTKKAAEHILKILESHYRVRYIGEMDIDGKKHKTVWELLG